MKQLIDINNEGAKPALTFSFAIALENPTELTMPEVMSVFVFKWTLPCMIVKFNYFSSLITAIEK